MADLEESKKRSAGDSDKAPAPKRGRGRPPKDPNAPRPPPKDPNAPKRGRGRPRKDPSTLPAKPVGTGRGRGRPRKDETTASSTQAPSSTKKTPKAASKSNAKFSDLIGVYDITCEAVEEDWPDAAKGMHLSITLLPHARAVLIASFDLGILEGTMLLSPDKVTLEAVRRQKEGGTAVKAAPDPGLGSRTVYYVWRGRDTGDSDQVHTGSNGDQTGVLTFDNDKFTSFSGVGAFPALGGECKFSGTKTDHVAGAEPEPWDHFDEEARENANGTRWR